MRNEMKSALSETFDANSISLMRKFVTCQEQKIKLIFTTKYNVLEEYPYITVPVSHSFEIRANLVITILYREEFTRRNLTEQVMLHQSDLLCEFNRLDGSQATGA